MNFYEPKDLYGSRRETEESNLPHIQQYTFCKSVGKVFRFPGTKTRISKESGNFQTFRYVASWIHGKGRNFCSGSDKQEIQVSYQKIQMGKKLALEYNVQDTIRIFQTKEIILKNN